MSYTILDTADNVTAKLPALKAAGYTDIIRYDDRFPSGNWKQIHSPEVHAIRDAGMRLGIVYEHGAQPAGEDNGFADATYSRKMAATRGQPAGSAIYFAVDYDASTGELSRNIVPYFRGVARALEGSGFRVGVYGSGMVCKTLKALDLVTLTWITCSRGFSGSREYVAAGLQDLWQVECDKMLEGLSVDYNQARNPDWGAFVPWGAPAVPDPLTPPPTIHHDAFWLQEVLQKAGFYHGVIDGDVGPGTIAGMIAYAEQYTAAA